MLKRSPENRITDANLNPNDLDNTQSPPQQFNNTSIVSVDKSIRDFLQEQDAELLKLILEEQRDSEPFFYQEAEETNNQNSCDENTIFDLNLHENAQVCNEWLLKEICITTDYYKDNCHTLFQSNLVNHVTHTPVINSSNTELTTQTVEKDSKTEQSQNSVLGKRKNHPVENDSDLEEILNKKFAR